ncbi:MAG: GAF domain-containing protein [Anaerolineales bacterium]
MNAMVAQPVMQLVVWGIGLFQLILALYVLILNSQHTANRHTSALFLLFSINSFAMGAMIGAETIAEGTLPAIILAATSPIAGIALLLTAIVLIKPDWLSGRGRWFWRSLYVLAALPIIFTAIDVLSNSTIWFVGLPENYPGGYMQLDDYLNPALSGFRFFFLVVIPLLTIIPLTYFSFLDKGLAKGKRNLAGLLFAAHVGDTFALFFIESFFPQPFSIVITNTFFFSVYAYASFSQAISERRLQRGRVQSRLTALVLAISTPLLIFTSAYLFSQTSSQIRQDAVGRLAQISQSVATTTETWLDLNIKALEQMTTLPGIISMDPEQQKPILQAVDNAYPHMYLVSTTNLLGINVARSDDNNLTNYSDRLWYQKAFLGADVAFQSLIGRTSGEPAIVVSKPIYSQDQEIVGVGMFASDLNDISLEVANIAVGKTGRLFIVDPDNQVVAHTNPEFANQLFDFSQHPAVIVMRNPDFDQNVIRYTDQNGTVWLSFFKELDYGWGVVIEQDEAELFSTLHNLQIGTWTVIILGTLLLGALTALAIWQTILPINSLTETATAIASGDLSRVAPVESLDEFGLLAQTFNRMTEQLLELIGSLEQRVAARTKDLEKRSNQLEAAAQVGRAASSVLDVNELIQNAVELIRDRFNLYYVGLFLVDEFQEYAVLRAGTGEAGKAMLARQHMIQIGEGMIGWTVANGLPRVAMEVGEDAIRKPTAELPETRSEAAIPLRSRGQIIGAITVQSTRQGEFDEPTVAVLQTMADLVSVAIENARLYTESENALLSTRRAYSDLAREDWMKLLQTGSGLSYRSDRQGTGPAREVLTPEMHQAWIEESTVVADQNGAEEDTYTLAIPIKVRGNIIGVMQTHKNKQAGKWTLEEKTMLETILEQVGVALDSARLYQETRIQANNERLIGEISANMRQTLDIETVLQTAVRELRSALDLAEVEIRMGSAPKQDGTENSG